jgi:uncharacterized protein (DUF302 family)
MGQYYFSKVLTSSFEDAIQRVTEILSQEGFGILSDIDVKATLKMRLDVDFKNYRILGACHPPSAYKALVAEDKIGTMLPCNIVVQEHESGMIEVSAIDPIASMISVQNENLGSVALDVQNKLRNVIEQL